jgi:Leucine-rich repeat (LRR) protein
MRLKFADIGTNLFDGSIPTELGNLLSLEDFALSISLMDGSVPSEFGNLVNLEALYLNGNALDGSIPSELSNLANLKELGINSNSLNGSIPSELGSLVKLTTVFFYDNFLSGSIPSEMGNLLSLVTMELYNNSLEGPIPSELGNLVNLQVLALSGNSLEGSIPSEMGNLMNLMVLYLYDNSLQGSIPSELGNLVNLEYVFLYGNSLQGSVPAELGNLADLKMVSLSDNALLGTLPYTIGGWSQLQSANLSGNMFSGEMEVFAVRNFTSLQVLDLSGNRFSGTISPSVFALPVLQSLVLSQNCFSGSLPSSMCLSDKLSSIMMDILTGNCNNKVSNVFQGKVLSNYMTGTIPSCIWNSSSIRTLHLLGNGLEGSLLDISDASVLFVLALGSNQLTGPIPVTMQQHRFAQLDLSINRLSGTLISDLFVSQHATVYDLSVNRLSGNIPGALYSSYPAGVINVLEGNLFGCQQDNIPPSDVSHSSYQCGSVNFQYSSIAWAVAFMLCLIVIVMATLGSDKAKRICRCVFESRELASTIVGPMCCFGACLVALVTYIAMKLSSEEAFIGTYRVQYLWTSTIAFTHNWIVGTFLFLVLGVICVVFTAAVMCISGNTALERYTTSRTCVTITLAYRIMAHLVNVIVVMIVNGCYVLAAIGSVNSSSLLAIQALLGVFKLSWSSWVIPWLLSRAGMTDLYHVSHWLFMLLFVFLGHLLRLLLANQALASCMY